MDVVDVGPHHDLCYTGGRDDVMKVSKVKVTNISTDFVQGFGF